MIDPHTSVAKCVADKLQLGKEVPVIISATAHFSKFSDGILDAFGIRTPTDQAASVMKTALDLTEKPGVHKYLWEDVQLPRHHKTVSVIRFRCSASLMLITLLGFCVSRFVHLSKILSERILNIF